MSEQAREGGEERRVKKGGNQPEKSLEHEKEVNINLETISMQLTSILKDIHSRLLHAGQEL